MRKSLFFALVSLASFAFAQVQSVAVLKSLADKDSKITPGELEHLTKELQSIALKELAPVSANYSLMTREDVEKAYSTLPGGEKAYADACDDQSCVKVFVEELGLDFGTRCDVTTVNKQLYLRCELFGTLKGRKAEILGQVESTSIKDIGEAVAVIKNKAPAMFDRLTKTEEQLCRAESKDNIWINETCTTKEKMAQDECKKRGSDYTLDNGICKSKDQITCEATPGSKWDGKDCKTQAQIACESEDNEWKDGKCITDLQIRQEMCKNKGDNYKWRGNACKSIQQIDCEAEGKKWIGEDCKSIEQIACEDRPNYDWINGSCKLRQATTPTQASGGYVPQPEAPKTYQVHFSSYPSGARLSVEGEGSCQTPCSMRLKIGRIKVSAGGDSFYERQNMEVNVTEDGQRVSLPLKPLFGTLNIYPVYSEGLGKNEGWTLTANGMSYYLGEVNLLPGDYKLKLTHSCYEDIETDVKIERGKAVNFDMSGKLALKQGTLVLRAKRKLRNISQSVVVNGSKVGQTPYEGAVPICSEIKVGNEGKERVVHVKMEQNKPVEYVHKDGTVKSHLLGAALDVAGAVFLWQSFSAKSDRDKYHDDYSELKKVGDRAEFDAAWKKVEDAHSKSNTFMIIGGAALAVGIGVHVWF